MHWRVGKVLFLQNYQQSKEKVQFEGNALRLGTSIISFVTITNRTDCILEESNQFFRFSNIGYIFMLIQEFITFQNESDFIPSSYDFIALKVCAAMKVNHTTCSLIDPSTNCLWCCSEVCTLDCIQFPFQWYSSLGYLKYSAKLWLSSSSLFNKIICESLKSESSFFKN